MIGQSVINVKSGGRTRLSTFLAGLLLLIMVVFLSDWISIIPMAALVAVMIMVSIGTFSWSSVINLKKNPLSSNLVMLTTVAVVVATHNLAYGVFIGVLMAAMFFANKIGHYMAVTSELDEHNNARTYHVYGEVFFRSADKFIKGFDMKEKLQTVVIDLTHAHFWDITSVAALDKVVLKFRKEGATVNVVGMNEATKTIVDDFGVHHKPEQISQVMGH